MADPILGLNAKLYRNTGTWATPSWNEMDNVKDLTLNLTKGEADVSKRGSSWRLTVGTLLTAELTFQSIWDEDDTDLAAIQSAFLNGTSIELLILDKAVLSTGAQGLHAMFQITRYTRNEQLEQALTVDITAKPAYETTDVPEWFTVS